ncbi:MAG: hypothetical protein JXA00_01820 [Candidatus Thermoplasmatota archaeon]|nr:hypothetical protein [Candidatus Thermoplasmatota archaeon]
MMKKSMAVAVILLFLGVTVAPSINFNVVKADSDDDLIEVTSEACGIQGLLPKTVKLTRQEYQNLEQYLVELRARLNTTTSREEAVSIFNEAVMELETYGLLPQGLSVEQAQALVIARYHPTYTNARTTIRNSALTVFNTSNYFCLITAETSNTRIISIPEMSCATLLYGLIGVYIITNFLIKDPLILSTLITHLRATCTGFQNRTSNRLIRAGGVIFGTSRDAYLPPEFRYHPAGGWVETQGLIGKKSWNGTFFGGVRHLPNFEQSSSTSYIGASGFSGLSLKQSGGTHYLLGSAVHVSLDYFEF